MSAKDLTTEARLATGTYVEVGPIRDAVLAVVLSPDGPSWADICNRLGWARWRCTNGPGTPEHWSAETTRLKRTLGLVKAHGGRRPGGGAYPPRCYRCVTRDNAAKIIRAIGRDPWEFGL